MDDIPPKLRIRANKQVEFAMSITHWLKVADALEEVAERKWEEGGTRAREWIFQQQMADQIRMGCAENLGHSK